MTIGPYAFEGAAETPAQPTDHGWATIKDKMLYITMRPCLIVIIVKVTSKKSIERLPANIKYIRVVHYLTEKMVETLLQKCKRLEMIILTKTASKKTCKKTRDILKSHGIDVVYDRFAQGRPLKISRVDLVMIKELRSNGLSCSKIADIVNLSERHTRRILNDQLRFVRWSEDYNGGLKLGSPVWIPIRDANPDARKLADNHYSRKTKGATFFCGPGEKMVLMTPEKQALFIWRKNKIRWDKQRGVECALFRNEGAGLSSDLIREAVKLAKTKWPRERLFTYVNPNAIKSTHPGFCFKRAGWKNVGTNKNGKLIVLEVPQK